MIHKLKCPAWSMELNFSPFGPAVWPAIGNIQGVPRNMTLVELF